jgi:hypothetical protein
MTTKSSYELLKKQIEVREKYFADLAVIWEDVQKAKVECVKAETACERCRADFDSFLARTRKKKKSGRPGIWKSKLGADFASLVCYYQQEHKGCSLSRAIRAVLKRPEFKKLNRKGRSPESRFQEAHQFLRDTSPFNFGGAIKLNAYLLSIDDLEAANSKYRTALERYELKVKSMPPRLSVTVF